MVCVICFFMILSPLCPFVSLFPLSSFYLFFFFFTCTFSFIRFSISTSDILLGIFRVLFFLNLLTSSASFTSLTLSAPPLFFPLISSSTLSSSSFLPFTSSSSPACQFFHFPSSSTLHLFLLLDPFLFFVLPLLYPLPPILCLFFLFTSTLILSSPSPPFPLLPPS